jgi:hypothetical protein
MKVTGSIPSFLDEHQFAATIERWDSLVSPIQEFREERHSLSLALQEAEDISRGDGLTVEDDLN